MPKLSVLLSAYNAEKYVAQAIDSILGQTFSDFELILADDGSIDRTKQILDQYQSNERVVISHNDINQGKTKTINRLFQLAKGTYVTIHDADDWSDPFRFQRQIDFLDANPEYGVCGTGFISVSSSDKMIEKRLMSCSNEEIVEGMSQTSQMHGPTAVFRRNIARTFDSIYREYFEDNFEDIDFLYRLLSVAKGHNLPEYLYYYRILPHSLCRKHVSIKNRNLYRVVLHLTNQRKGGEKDDLEKGRVELVEDYFYEITETYRKDRSLINREAAAYYMYWKFYKKAIQESVKAILKEPLNFRNFRTLQYCLRKSILRF
ncbi:MAG: glycosyltransferase family 2 protein [Cyclobacteriaceae bacterium]|nr:glycosyltransferase family 2 protein [Cyclobacteriaceae bacterium]